MSHRLLLIGLLISCAAGGCRLTGRDGPVPKQLALSREFSQRGASALDQGDSVQAAGLLRQAVENCPENAEARGFYADCLWQRGQQQEALAQVEEAIKVATDDESMLLRAARMQMELGHSEQAWHSVNSAIDVNPRTAEAWALRGRLRQQAGQSRDALADLHRALSYDKRNREVLLAVGEVYLELNEPQRGLRSLQSLADTYNAGEEPDRVLYLEGVAYLALGRPSEAADVLTLARSHGQPTPEVLVLLAEAQLAAGRAPEARLVLHQALELDPQNTASRALLERIDVVQR